MSVESSKFSTRTRHAPPTSAPISSWSSISPRARAPSWASSGGPAGQGMGAIGRRALQALRPVARLADRRVLLGLIVLVALGCRMAGAGDRLSPDEGYSWLVASARGWQGFLDSLARYENTPPLYYL